MAKHAQGSRFGRKAMLGTAMAVVVAGGSGVALAANAAENEVYDQAQLLQSCQEKTSLYGKADRCRFEPASYDGFTGELVQVSGVDSNCGSADVTREVRWQQSTTESNSIEVSASVEAGLTKIFSASVSTTFGHTWEQTTGKEDAVSMTIPPLSAGTVFRGAPVAKVTGRMVINFGSRRQGHFEWYAYPTLIVPAEDQPNLARIVTNTRPLTDTEKDACPDVPGGSKLQITIPPEAQQVVQEGADATAQTAGSLNPDEQHATD
jgi:hypothetical protein